MSLPADWGRSLFGHMAAATTTDTHTDTITHTPTHSRTHTTHARTDTPTPPPAPTHSLTHSLSHCNTRTKTKIGTRNKSNDAFGRSRPSSRRHTFSIIPTSHPRGETVTRSHPRGETATETFPPLLQLDRLNMNGVAPRDRHSMNKHHSWKSAPGPLSRRRSWYF